MPCNGTYACQNHCKHCYASDTRPHEGEDGSELDFHAMIRVLDDYRAFLDRWNIVGRIELTGGDPLLHPRVMDLIREIRARGIEFSILGNPHCVNEDIARRLREYEISFYQISIDGMRETHDLIRGRGSFEDSLRAIRVLRDNGVLVGVAFTLGKHNVDDLLDVLTLSCEEKVGGIGFARCVPIGNAKSSSIGLFSPDEYKDLLGRVHAHEQSLRRKNESFVVSRKDHLWTLYFYELGAFVPKPGVVNPIGCSIGYNSLVVLADGSVLPCRRLPLKIGKIPQDTLRQLFLGSPLLKSFRRLGSFEKCRSCLLGPHCKGCPSIAFACKGDYFAADPQCWHQVKQEVS